MYIQELFLYLYTSFFVFMIVYHFGIYGCYFYLLIYIYGGQIHTHTHDKDVYSKQQL